MPEQEPYITVPDVPEPRPVLDVPEPMPVPTWLSHAHEWLAGLVWLGVVAVLVVSLLAMPEESRMQWGDVVVSGDIVDWLGMASMASLTVLLAVSVSRDERPDPDLVATPALVAAIGTLCLGLAVHSTPGIVAFGVAAVLFLAWAGTKVALDRAEERAWIAAGGWKSPSTTSPDRSS